MRKETKDPRLVIGMTEGIIDIETNIDKIIQITEIVYSTLSRKYIQIWMFRYFGFEFAYFPREIKRHLQSLPSNDDSNQTFFLLIYSCMFDIDIIQFYSGYTQGLGTL